MSCYFVSSSFFFFCMTRHPPISTLFPYTTLFRSIASQEDFHTFALKPKKVGDGRAGDQLRLVHHRDIVSHLDTEVDGPWFLVMEIGRAHVWNSSHLVISYAVFCLKKKKKHKKITQ